MVNALIAPKPFAAFAPDEYHAYVSSMYELRTKGRAKPASPAAGLTVRRTPEGALSIARSKAQRAFEYVTWPELAKLAEALKVGQSDLWQAFRAKNYIVAKDRLAAEHTYSALVAEGGGCS